MRLDLERDKVYILEGILIIGGIMKTTARDLRFFSKEILNTVSRGEEVVITYRGKPCARIVPYQETKDNAYQDTLFGMWGDNEAIENVNDYVRRLRQARPI